MGVCESKCPQSGTRNGVFDPAGRVAGGLVGHQDGVLIQQGTPLQLRLLLRTGFQLRQLLIKPSAESVQEAVLPGSRRALCAEEEESCWTSSWKTERLRPSGAGNPKSCLSFRQEEGEILLICPRSTKVLLAGHSPESRWIQTRVEPLGTLQVLLAWLRWVTLFSEDLPLVRPLVQKSALRSMKELQELSQAHVEAKTVSTGERRTAARARCMCPEGTLV
ncbi:hypothetical protein Cadr_000015557 [Camelus dromedarius]|uniref:Uncharacterized protein n=1 Tax=Camelus dromedarius TaxID=9838 RepID=A0A5N4EAG2_CAMDR|nr:hypothetical protein Cadr_000015557 [Camelus dromedarius]